MKIAAAPSDLTVAVWAGCAPRLLRTRPGVEDFAEYRRHDGYRPLIGADGLLEEVEMSGLLGRGGAAFPMAVKLRTVRAAGRRGHDTVVVANGEEGEPASIKDKWLLRHRPHLVLDGLRLASQIVNARRAYVYVSDPRSASCVEAALAELDREVLGDLTITAMTVAPTYIAGRKPPRSAPSTAARPNPPTSRRARSSMASAGCPRW